MTDLSPQVDEENSGPAAPRTGAARNALLTTLCLVPWLVMALLAAQNVMVAPPHSFDTLTLYGSLWLLGFITFFIAARQQKVKSRFQGCLIAVLGMLVLFFLLALTGPLLGAVMGVFMSADSCSTVSLPDGNVRYTCYVTSSPTYTLEGPSGLPFVRFIGRGLDNGG